MLGLDFLEAHNCTIQAGQKRIILGNGRISIPLDGNAQSIWGDEIRINHIEMSVCEPITVPAQRRIQGGGTRGTCPPPPPPPSLINS